MKFWFFNQQASLWIKGSLWSILIFRGTQKFISQKCWSNHFQVLQSFSSKFFFNSLSNRSQIFEFHKFFQSQWLKSYPSSSLSSFTTCFGFHSSWNFLTPANALLSFQAWWFLHQWPWRFLTATCCQRNTKECLGWNRWKSASKQLFVSSPLSWSWLWYGHRLKSSATAFWRWSSKTFTDLDWRNFLQPPSCRQSLTRSCVTPWLQPETCKQ